MTYHKLNTLLQGRNKSQRKLGHNTYATRFDLLDPSIISIRYHATNVLTFHPDGRVVFNSGGWRTSTTKQRLNRYGPSGVYIHQHQFNWFITTDAGTQPFYDGITFHCPTFTPLPADSSAIR